MKLRKRLASGKCVYDALAGEVPAVITRTLSAGEGSENAHLDSILCLL